MAELTFEDAQDLVRYIVLHPELQAQLRPVILSAELLDLPDLVRRNSEAIEQLGIRTDQLTVRVDQLGERMDQLTVRVDQLGERMDQLSLRIDQLGEQIRQLTIAVHELTARSHSFEIWQGKADGRLLEATLERTLPRRLGKYVRRPRVVSAESLEPVELALDEGRLTSLDWDSLMLADFVVLGRSKVTGRELALVVEASVTIDEHDLRRAFDRAKILAATGFETVPLVAGDSIRPEDEARARESHIALLVDENFRYWPEGS